MAVGLGSVKSGRNGVLCIGLETTKARFRWRVVCVTRATSCRVGSKKKDAALGTDAAVKVVASFRFIAVSANPAGLHVGMSADLLARFRNLRLPSLSVQFHSETADAYQATPLF